MIIVSACMVQSFAVQIILFIFDSATAASDVMFQHLPESVTKLTIQTLKAMHVCISTVTNQLYSYVFTSLKSWNLGYLINDNNIP